MNDELLSISLLNLYETFKIYPLKDVIEGCPHCVGKNDGKSLHGKELRKLTWTDIGKYELQAITTFGDLEDYKHFLPRLVELYIKDYSHSIYGIDLFLRKLVDNEFHKWPEEEYKSIGKCIIQWKLSMERENPDNYVLIDLVNALEDNRIVISNSELFVVDYYGKRIESK